MSDPPQKKVDRSRWTMCGEEWGMASFPPIILSSLASAEKKTNIVVKHR